MSGHTPGPWRTSWSYAGCWLVYCSNDPSASSHTHFSPEREADARLIAAAPMLLEALRKCAAQLEIISGMVHDERMALIEARAAIAAATGETK